MQIILSNQCLSLTGMLDSSCGYYIRRSRNGNFYGQRSKGFVPPDGHWRFILTCAQLAQNGLYLSDIRLSSDELWDALYDAGHRLAADNVIKNELIKPRYNARDIINLKITFGL